MMWKINAWNLFHFRSQKCRQELIGCDIIYEQQKYKVAIVNTNSPFGGMDFPPWLVWTSQANAHAKDARSYIGALWFYV